MGAAETAPFCPTEETMPEADEIENKGDVDA